VRAIALSTLCLSFPPRPTRSRPLGCQAATTMGSLTDRECPCPDRILAIGAVGGSFFHFVKGLCNAPTAAGFTGGPEAVRMNAPRIGSSFAVGEACTRYVIVPSCMCVRRIPGTLFFLVRHWWHPFFTLGICSVICPSMHVEILFALLNGAIIMMQCSQPDPIYVS
jgi:hypothetical protein